MTKSSKKILMISYQFPPDTGSVRRVLDFVKYLPEYNWTPIILTHRSKHEHAKIDDELLKNGIKVYRRGQEYTVTYLAESMYTKASILMKSSSSLDVVKLRIYRYSKLIYQKVRDFFVWPDKFVWWVPVAIFEASKIIRSENIKTIYIVTPPHSATIVGYCLKLLFGVNLVLDFRDPWANDIDIVMPTRVHSWLHRKTESATLRAADTVIASTSFHTDYFKNILPENHRSKLRTITNGVDLSKFLPSRSKEIERFTIVHAGNFDGSRDPRCFLEAVANVSKNSPDVFKKDSVLLFGNINPMVARYIEDLNLESIVCQMGLKSHDEILEVMSEAAVLLLVVHNDLTTSKYCIPAKLFEYMATGRPIIAVSPNGAAAQIIVDYSIGTVVGHSPVKNIEDVILHYHDRHSSGDLVSKIPERKVLQKFDRKELTKQLAIILNDLEQ